MNQILAERNLELGVMREICAGKWRVRLPGVSRATGHSDSRTM